MLAAFPFDAPWFTAVAVGEFDALVIDVPKNPGIGEMIASIAIATTAIPSRAPTEMSRLAISIGNSLRTLCGGAPGL